MRARSCRSDACQHRSGGKRMPLLLFICLLSEVSAFSPAASPTLLPCQHFGQFSCLSAAVHADDDGNADLPPHSHKDVEALKAISFQSPSVPGAQYTQPKQKARRSWKAQAFATPRDDTMVYGARSYFQQDSPRLGDSARPAPGSGGNTKLASSNVRRSFDSLAPIQPSTASPTFSSSMATQRVSWTPPLHKKKNSTSEPSTTSPLFTSSTEATQKISWAPPAIDNRKKVTKTFAQTTNPVLTQTGPYAKVPYTSKAKQPELGSIQKKKFQQQEEARRHVKAPDTSQPELPEPDSALSVSFQEQELWQHEQARRHAKAPDTSQPQLPEPGSVTSLPSRKQKIQQQELAPRQRDEVRAVLTQKDPFRKMPERVPTNPVLLQEQELRRQEQARRQRQEYFERVRQERRRALEARQAQVERAFQQKMIEQQKELERLATLQTQMQGQIELLKLSQQRKWQEHQLKIQQEQDRLEERQRAIEKARQRQLQEQERLRRQEAERRQEERRRQELLSTVQKLQAQARAEAQRKRQEIIAAKLQALKEKAEKDAIERERQQEEEAKAKLQQQQYDMMESDFKDESQPPLGKLELRGSAAGPQREVVNALEAARQRGQEAARRKALEVERKMQELEKAKQAVLWKARQRAQEEQMRRQQLQQAEQLQRQRHQQELQNLKASLQPVKPSFKDDQSRQEDLEDPQELEWQQRQEELRARLEGKEVERKDRVVAKIRAFFANRDVEEEDEVDDFSREWLDYDREWVVTTSSSLTSPVEELPTDIVLEDEDVDDNFEDILQHLALPEDDDKAREVETKIGMSAGEKESLKMRAVFSFGSSPGTENPSETKSTTKKEPFFVKTKPTKQEEE